MFIRRFEQENIEKLFRGKNADLFARLKADVAAGEVFPAVRKDELHFYYKGGCLYAFRGGAFVRDGAYAKYAVGAGGEEYELAKAQNAAKFSNVAGGAKERRLLDGLYSSTSGAERERVVVLDIEVNLNGSVGGGRKCDLVFLDTQTDTLVFVEGKVFSDRRMRAAEGYVPPVAQQVKLYSAALAEQHDIILQQYGEHVAIINKLFGTEYCKPKRLCKMVKLLVYETEEPLHERARRVCERLNGLLGEENILWVKRGERPSCEEIGRALSGGKTWS